jgi:ribonuclease HI
MLSANQFDMAPKASTLVLEVWANKAAQLARGTPGIQSYNMPGEPLKALQDMSGGRWESFHAGSQDFVYRNVAGIVAATDGSIVKDEEGIVRMGGGVAFRAGDHGLSNMCVHARGHISSFVAEGAAALAALQQVPTNADLTILTDSANVMFTMQHCSRKEQWRDFTDHPEAELIGELAKALAARTASTKWVKIKSHRSVYLNEKADELATNAYSDSDAPSYSFDRREERNVLHIWKADDNGKVLVQSQELQDHFVQLRQLRVLKDSTRITETERTYTATVQKMMAPGMGRYLLHQVLWQTSGVFSLDDRTAKRMLQCLTSTYPTMGRLHVMGKAATAACPFCSEETETLGHWQQECAQFADARTKVHDDVWTAVYKSILRRLPKGVEGYKETTIGMTDLRFTDLQTGLNVLKPDGIFFNRTTCEWTIVDYTRSSGDTREELSKAEQHKVDTYGPVVTAWEQLKLVKFYPLASTYHGAIAEDAWRACLDRLGIDSKAQEEILLTAVKAICMGFSSMVDIRYGALNNMHSRTSLRAPQGQRDHNP